MDHTLTVHNCCSQDSRHARLLWQELDFRRQHRGRASWIRGLRLDRMVGDTLWLGHDESVQGFSF